MTDMPARISLVDDPFLQGISQQIKKAADDTSKNLSNRFLPNPRLIEILSRSNLNRLFNVFFDTMPTRRVSDASGTAKSDISGQGIHEATSCYLETYVEKTLSAPSRTSLLALLLYDLRIQSLEYFKEWLFDQRRLPSDEDLPLSPTDAELFFPLCDVKYILDYQGVFRPLIIREGEHEVLVSSKHRKPFVGDSEKISRGASGCVYKVKIAAGHWMYKKYGVESSIESEITVAMKVFRKENDSSAEAEAATEHFTREKNFLAKLKNNHTSHKLIVQDLGSITEIFETGEPIHHLFFDLAVCNLEDILRGREFARQYEPSGHAIIAKIVDLLEALACLHRLRFLHLDLKPDNILVFQSGGNKDDYLWKFGDFDLSTERERHTVRRASDTEISMSPSLVPAARAVGRCQAPEIQYLRTSLASEGSDCWSMGVIILLLLALAYQGAEGFRRFESGAKIHESIGHASCWLFYVTEEMKQWPQDPLGPYRFLDNFRPETGVIEVIGRKLEAVVHPGILEESKRLYEATENPECERLKKALCIIFRRVLVINRKSRMRASELHREFIKVRDYDPSAEKEHSKLCCAMQNTGTEHLEVIIRDFAATNMQLLDTNTNPAEANMGILNPNAQCPLCMKYPIHQALRKNNPEFLKKFLSGPWYINVNLPCPDSHMLPIAIACEGSGDWLAIDNLFRYKKDKILVPDGFYKAHRDNLSKNAKDRLREGLKTSGRRNSENSFQRNSRSSFSYLRPFRSNN